MPGEAQVLRKGAQSAGVGFRRRGAKGLGQPAPAHLVAFAEHDTRCVQVVGLNEVSHGRVGHWVGRVGREQGHGGVFQPDVFPQGVARVVVFAQQLASLVVRKEHGAGRSAAAVFAHAQALGVVVEAGGDAVFGQAVEPPRSAVNAGVAGAGVAAGGVGGGVACGVVGEAARGGGDAG